MRKVLPEPGTPYRPMIVGLGLDMVEVGGDVRFHTGFGGFEGDGMVSRSVVSVMRE